MRSLTAKEAETKEDTDVVKPHDPLDEAFEAQYTDEEAALRAEALALFERTDFNNNGTLSHTELKKEIQKDAELREKLSANKWKVFFAEIDSDGELIDKYLS